MPKKAPVARWCSECGNLTDHFTAQHKASQLTKAIFDEEPEEKPALAPSLSESDVWKIVGYVEKEIPPTPSDTHCTGHVWGTLLDESTNKEVTSCLKCGASKPKKLPAPKLNPEWEKKAVAQETPFVGIDCKCVYCVAEENKMEALPPSNPCVHSWGKPNHLAYQDLYVSTCTKCGKTKTGEYLSLQCGHTFVYKDHFGHMVCEHCGYNLT